MELIISISALIISIVTLILQFTAYNYTKPQLSLKCRKEYSLFYTKQNNQYFLSFYGYLINPSNCEITVEEFKLIIYSKDNKKKILTNLFSPPQINVRYLNKELLEEQVNTIHTTPYRIKANDSHKCFISFKVLPEDIKNFNYIKVRLFYLDKYIDINLSNIKDYTN